MTVDGVSTAFAYDPYGNLTGLVTPAGLGLGLGVDASIGQVLPDGSRIWTQSVVGQVTAKTPLAPYEAHVGGGGTWVSPTLDIGGFFHWLFGG